MCSEPRLTSSGSQPTTVQAVGEMDGQSHGPAQREGEHLKTQVSTMEQTVPRVSCRLVNDES